VNNVAVRSAEKYGREKTALVSRDGIALLLVLWVLTILMVIVLSFSFMARTETLSTRSFKEGIEKKFLAEAGIERGIVEIFYGKQNPGIESGDVWKTDGTAYPAQMGEDSYTVRITDESGKIDINTLTDSSGIILKNLLITSGAKDEDTSTIVDSILDWKDKNIGMHRLHGAGDDYYMSLPNPYKVKHADFDTVEELLLVKGVTPGILYGDGERKGIIDFLTCYSKTAGVNINAAPKEVLTAVPGITPEIADVIIDFRQNKKITNAQDVGVQPQSSPYITYADSNTFTIEAIGHKGDSAKGYAVKATVTLQGSSQYKFVYYKSPANIAQ
jgi:general secretion pathway protein K